LQSAALDLTSRLARRRDEPGLNEGAEHADLLVELAALDLDRWQRLGQSAFLEGCARGLGGFFGGSAAVQERGRFGGQHFLRLVYFLAFERRKAFDLV